MQIQDVLPRPDLDVAFDPELVTGPSRDWLGLPFEIWIAIGVAAVLVVIVALVMRARAAARPRPALPSEREDVVVPRRDGEPVPVRGGEPQRAEPAPRALAEGLGRTRDGFVGRIRSLISGRTIDVSVVDELEEVLFTSDLGVKTATALLAELRDKVTRNEASDLPALQRILKDGIRRRLGEKPAPMTFANGEGHAYVVMVVGVNGVGKTTTIGKLARQIAEGLYGGPKRKVLLCAGDTFRAAAVEQLTIWGQRVGVEVISNKEGTDPSAVAFDAAKAAVARGIDVLIVDTAGRLHTKTNLMEELKKVKRILAREIPGAPHEVLLVVDATTGQNALNQAKEFNAGVGITGIVLTKLDGTAKGGIVVGIRDELGIPVRYIGIGEGVEDLRAFDPDAFVDALFA